MLAYLYSFIYSDNFLYNILSDINKNSKIKTLEHWFLFHDNFLSYLRKDIKYTAIHHNISSLSKTENIDAKERNIALYSSCPDVIICNKLLEFDKHWEIMFDNLLFSFQNFAYCILTIPFNNTNKDIKKENGISISRKKFYEVLDKYKNITTEIEIKDIEVSKQVMIFKFIK